MPGDRGGKWAESLIVVLLYLLWVAIEILSERGGQWGRLATLGGLKIALDYVLSTLVAICIFCNIRAWIKRKFWFPTYLHVVAILMYAGFLFCIFDPQRWILASIVSLFVPCFLYSAFVVLGGVEAAAERKR